MNNEDLKKIAKEGLEPYTNAMVDYKKLCDEKDKEIERQSKMLINRDKELLKVNDELEKLNNIINEMKQKLNLAENILYDYLYEDKKITKELYDSFKELKGDSSNE